LQGEFSFHGLTVNANMFFATNATPFMKFILIKPYGPDHYINGLTVADNLFKETNGPALEAVEGVDASIAPLDLTRANDLLFAGNTFHGVTKRTENPVTAARRKTAPRRSGTSIFRCAALRVRGRHRVSALADGVIETQPRCRSSPCRTRWPGRALRAGDQLHWPEPVRGAVHLTARCDT
jgi:hypothetical protein